MDETSSFDIVSELEILYNNFLGAESEDDKTHWLYVFLFTYETQKGSIRHCNDSFLATVPSEIFSYFLQLVCSIIRSSVNSESTYQSDIPKRENEEDSKKISHLVLNSPTDITAIVALREFLMHGIGRHILEYFQKCDVESIACKRELACILINLFPNTPWKMNNEDVSLPRRMKTSWSVEQYLDNFVLQNSFSMPRKSHISLDSDDEDISSTKVGIKSTEQCSPNHIEIHNNIVTIEYDTEKLEIYKKGKLSSDDIAFILIEILMKLVEQECNEYISEKAITVKCMDFGLKMLKTVDGALAYGENVYEIKTQLILMLTLCFNNLFKKQENLIFMKEADVFEKLIEDWEKNFAVEEIGEKTYSFKFSCYLLYFTFSLFNNCIIVSSNKVSTFLGIYKTFKDNKMLERLKCLLKSDCEDNFYFRKILNVLLKMIEYLKVLEYNNFQYKKVKRKSDDKLSMICHQTHHKNTNLSCKLEMDIVEIFSDLSLVNQRAILKHFQKCGLCCCLCKVETVQIFLTEACKFKRLIYEFIERNILKPIFVNSTLCSNCLIKSKSKEFTNSLLEKYKIKNQYLNVPSEKTHFFKHLLKVSTFISYDITLELTFNVVLPNFYNEQDKDVSEWNLNVILACLNMIITNSTDKRLIKEFFVEKNINYLQKLIYVPELAKGVCNLIKVGIDNSSYLNSDSENKCDLISCLINTQLNASHSTLTILLEKLLIFDKILENNFPHTSGNNKLAIPEYESNFLCEIFKIKPINTSELLYLTAIYLKLSLHLYKTNSQYKNNLKKICLTIPFNKLIKNEGDNVMNTEESQENQENNKNNEQYDEFLFILVYNTLKCFLYNIQEKSAIQFKETDSSESSCIYSASQVQSYDSTTKNMSIVSNDSDIDCRLLPVEEYLLNFYTTILYESVYYEFECICDENILNFNLFEYVILKRRRPYESIFSSSLVEDITVDSVGCKKSVEWSFLKVINSNNKNFIFHINNNNKLSKSINKNHKIVSNLPHKLAKIIVNFENFCNVEIKKREFLDGCAKNACESDNRKTLLNSFDLICLCNSLECKKLLIQIFESVFAIWILEMTHEKKGKTHLQVLAMTSSLQKLKALILANSFNNWEDLNKANSVLQILQSLLKVAELASPNFPRNDCKKHKNVKKCKFCSNHEIVSISQDSDTEFYSTNLSCGQFESDVEPSETETEDHYLTADEGYEADGEAQEITDSEDHYTDLLYPLTPSSQYKLSIAHEGITRIVVEILMVLSSKCVQNVSVWSVKLTELANRLYSIRETLGGPLFLIQGFAPILKKNEIGLREFQQSLLDLITDFNKPEILAAFFEMLSSDDPPVNLLVPYMTNSSLTSLRVQPTAEILFPVEHDGTLNAFNRPVFYDNVKLLYDYHKHHAYESPLVTAAMIVPLNNVKFRVWKEKQFTISTWFQISEWPLYMNANKKEDGSNAQTHLLSLGSNAYLFSVYITEDLSIVVETCKPNEDISHKPLKQSKSTTDIQTEKSTQAEAAKNNRKRKLWKDPVPIHESPTKNDKDSPVAPEKSSLANALESTRMALRTSLSQFHLFSHRNKDKTAEENRVKFNSIRLSKKKWTHLCISVEVKCNILHITLTLDATDQYTAKLPHSKQDFSKLETVQLLLIGSTTPNEDLFERSEIEKCMKFSLSSTMVFRKSVTSIATIANLTALGPDCSNLTNCQMGNLLPNYGFIRSAKIFSITIDDFNESVKFLRSQLVVLFTPHETESVVGYHNTDEDASIGIKLGLIQAGKTLKANKISSVQTAVYLCGGLGTLLYLFARVVELTPDSSIQEAALDLFFAVAHSDSILYSELIKNNCLELIGTVVRADQCAKDVRVLKSIINNACNMTVIAKRGDVIQVLENTNACIIYPHMIVYVIKKYCDWIKFNAKESFVLDTYLSSVQALVREKHPFQSYNLMQLCKTGFVNELMNFCKVYVIEAPNPIFISTQSAEYFINLLNTFAGAPPSASLLDELMKLLLLLHKPSECFVTHDRAKFYFLIKSDFPSRSKKMGLPLPSRNFRRIIRDKRKTEASSKQSLKNDSEEASANVSQPSESSGSSSKSRRVSDAVKSLESIVDCSKINKRSIDLLDPLEAAKMHKTPASSRTRRKNCGEHGVITRKIYRKRLRTYPRMSTESDGDWRRKKDRKISSIPDEIDILASHEYDIVNEDEVSQLNGSVINKRKIKNLSKVRCWFSPGVVKIQEGLLTLLKDFLLVLPDKSVCEVLTHYVKLELILVLANHQNCSVRTAFIKLLTVIYDRLPVSELNAANKKMYWFHLANQISLHPVDSEFIKECFSWITGLHLDIEQFLTQDDLKVHNPTCINTLIAVLPQTIFNEELTVNALRILRKIYSKDPKAMNNFIEIGLIQALVKLLSKCAERLKGNFSNILQEVSQFLFVIGYGSISSTGHITILWDILNLLTFCQEKANVSIIQAFRSVQASVLVDLIRRFVPLVPNQEEMKNFKAKLANMYLHNSGLSNSEVKTRFEMLLDRSVQFATSAPQSYKLSTQETDLFEILVSFGLNGIQKCSNLIILALTPSQPMQLKMFVIDNLWRISRTEKLSHIACDAKMLKTLLWSILSSERENLVQKTFDQLTIVCSKFGVISENSWDLETILDKLNVLREYASKEQKPFIEKSVLRFELVAQACIDTSMSITRIATELQNSERKLLISQMRQNDKCFPRREWSSIIERLSHEGSAWCNLKHYPKSWQLDDTEGPCRIRCRLKRCELDIDKRFFMIDEQAKSSNRSNKHSPLHYLKASYDQQLNICVNSQILFNFSAKHVQASGEIDGELIVTEKKIIFVATHTYKLYYIDCDIHAITEIWMRRYQHRENAFEIFMDTNKSLFFVLQREEDRKTLKELLTDKFLQCADQSKLAIITQQWREGQLNNWEYLMALNQISGRTYNDLMQYPVLPWILADYESQILDLTDEKSFRILSKPIAVQDAENEIHYTKNYEYLNQSATSFGCKTLKPYHYSSHYSNSGTVLHFLVRVPPFTSYFLRYQDNNFDIPDRTFHSLKTTWRLASRDSPTDVKELVPEFFCLPEMFENFEGFNFGTRQCGQMVNHVSLPPWCADDPRLFVLIHRQALESEVVRKYLHNWIDLIFGYKQTGIHAVEAINVFHPATYSEFTTSDITDPIEKKALETMIKTYGQMPKQLLMFPHPPSNDLQYQMSQKPVISSVKGLRWGVFTGSPQLPPPRICNIYRPLEADFFKLVSFSNTNVVYGIPEHTSVVQGATVDTYNIISWRYDDRIVRIRSLSDDENQTKPLFYDHPLDEITCCGSDCNSNTLWFGHKSGRITVYKSSTYELNKMNKNRIVSSGSKMSYNSAFRKISMKISVNVDEYDIINDPKNSNFENRLQNWAGPTVLLRHTDEVTAIRLSTEFKIAVSVGKDGLAVIWDGNNFNYVRTIDHPLEINRSPITLVDVSPTLGDILTVHAIKNPKNKGNETSEEEGFEITEENLDDFVNIYINLNGKSVIRLHTINAKYVKQCVIDEEVLSVCYSYVKEGSGVNVIATGHEGGTVRLWSSWDLNLVREIKVADSDVMSISFSTYQHLIVLLKENYVQVWESEGLYGSVPKLPQIVFQKNN